MRNRRRLIRRYWLMRSHRLEPSRRESRGAANGWTCRWLKSNVCIRTNARRVSGLFFSFYAILKFKVAAKLGYVTLRRNNAEAQTWKERLGSVGHRAGLHGNELFLRPAQRQAGDDLSASVSRRTRRHLLRHR